jgi:hypothetical protein
MTRDELFDLSDEALRRRKRELNLRIAYAPSSADRNVPEPPEVAEWIEERRAIAAILQSRRVEGV